MDLCRGPYLIAIVFREWTMGPFGVLSLGVEGLWGINL